MSQAHELARSHSLSALLAASLHSLHKDVRITALGDYHGWFFCSGFCFGQGEQVNLRLVEERMQKVLSDVEIRSTEMTACSAAASLASSGQESEAKPLKRLPPKELVSLVVVGSRRFVLEGPHEERREQLAHFHLLHLLPGEGGAWTFLGKGFDSAASAKSFFKEYRKNGRRRYCEIAGEMGLAEPIAAGSPVWCWTAKGVRLLEDFRAFLTEKLEEEGISCSLVHQKHREHWIEDRKEAAWLEWQQEAVPPFPIEPLLEPISGIKPVIHVVSPEIKEWEARIFSFVQNICEAVLVPYDSTHLYDCYGRTWEGPYIRLSGDRLEASPTGMIERFLTLALRANTNTMQTLFTGGIFGRRTKKR